MQTAVWIVMLLVFLALLFDFINGFHDEIGRAHV